MGCKRADYAGSYWIVWRIGGQKSHPGLHRVRSSVGFMAAMET